MERSSSSSMSLLDEALGLNDVAGGRIRSTLIEDCVETSGAFVLHHLIKRSLILSQNDAVVFLSFAHPFSHYDRVLRKMGCNLAAQRDNNRFMFLDLLTLECPGGFIELYGKVQRAIEDSALSGAKENVTIMIDDLSLMEVTANGSSNHVLDFLHYCHTLTTEYGCSLVILYHDDVYATTEKPFILQIEYLIDVIVKAEPLATGLASDVHGQLTVVDKVNFDGPERLHNKMRNFQFRVRENCVEYFYPGSRT